jgi:hypothetical protein
VPTDLSRRLSDMAQRGAWRGAEAVMASARTALGPARGVLAPESALRWRLPGPAVAAIAAAVVLIVAGGLYLVTGWPRSEPTVTTTPPVTTTTLPITTTTRPGTTTTTSITTSTSTTSMIPEMPASLGTTWHQVPEQPALQGGWIAAVTEGGPGLVAVGEARSETGQGVGAGVWVSSDGEAWERISSDAFGGSGMFDVLATSAGLVAVGTAGYEQEVVDATVWLSSDGLGWSRLSPLPHDDSVSPANSLLLGVVGGGPGLVAWGEDGNGPGVWASADGRAWELSTDPDLAPSREEIALAEQEGLCAGLTLSDVTAGDGLLVAVGYSTVGTCEGMPGDTLRLSPVVWVSADGLAWDRVPQDAIALPAPMPYSDWGFVMRGVTWTGAGFLAVGLGVWVSEDGRQWEALDATLYGSIFAEGWVIGEPAFVTDLDGRLVIAFPAGDVLWASGDGGVGWHASTSFERGVMETPDPVPTLTEVISTGQALVAVGSVTQWSGTEDLGSPCSRGSGWCRNDPAIWIGQWNEG